MEVENSRCPFADDAAFIRNVLKFDLESVSTFHWSEGSHPHLAVVAVADTAHEELQMLLGRRHDWYNHEVSSC